MSKYKFKKLFLMGMLSSFLFSKMVYAAPEEGERGEYNLRRNPRNIVHLTPFSFVLDYLVKNNPPTLRFNFCHKSLSHKELIGEIQYCLAYISLLKASLAVNFEQVRRNLNKASKWNRAAVHNGNKNAQRLFQMAFELVPQVTRAGQPRL
jgi:hypothetical protein